MKLNITQKCQVIGTLFLVAVTFVEIMLFLSIFDTSMFGGKGYAIIGTVIIFNIAIWIFGIEYHAIKEHLVEKENGNAD